MKYRREEVNELLPSDEVLMTLSNFPRLGTPNCTWPIYKPKSESGLSRSLYFPDEAISTCYLRWGALTQNIGKRRGKKINIDVPVFKDKNTQIPVDGAPADKPDAVHMDAMGLGLSCCSLQVTVQVKILCYIRRLLILMMRIINVLIYLGL